MLVEIPMIGQTVSHYKVLEPLGGGGMGVVYKAEDTRLKRTVALKFLPPELTRDPEAKERFIQEAQAASALQHPNICVVHDIDETADGQIFLCLEYLPGQTLKKKVERGPLKITEAIEIAVQVAQGLMKAHEQGIVHRDIKPANIMVTPDGVAKIVDFGLAKLSGPTMLTRAGSTLGTAAYMSPEQARGEPADHRTDIWSLGVVLYEMCAGRRPFDAEYENALTYAILNAEPNPLTGLRTGVPAELERIVGKAMAKNVAARYQHVEDMLVDLRALRSERESHPAPQKPVARGRRRRVVIAASVLGAVAVVAAAIAIVPSLLTQAGLQKERGTSDQRTMIVVLPFENLGSPEDEYFANGTTDAITARLASVSGLGVVSRQSAIQYKKSTKPTRQIGEELGVAYILEGTIQRERPRDRASRVRVIPQLIRVADDTHIWAEIYDKEMTEVFRVQSEIAENVATQLDVTLLEPERRAIEKRPTENLAAYEGYLQALDHLNSMKISDVETSVRLLREATSLDHNFAEAYAYLAMAHHELYWAFDSPGELALEMEAAERASDLAPDLPETQLARGFVAYAQRDFLRALEHFESADRLRPTGETAQAIGFTLRRLGRWQEALAYGEKARRLMPRSATVYTDILGVTLEFLRRFEEAVQAADRSIAISPEEPEGHLLKVAALAKRGDLKEAKEALLEMSRHTARADVAENQVPQGLTVWTPGTLFRLFPETFTESYTAFEAGPIERYRDTQPAVIASSHLARALLYEATGERPSAHDRFDSARICFERILRSNPKSAYVAAYQSDLGLACAGLGRCEEAIRAGEKAVRLMPISKDAAVGVALVGNLAEIYLRCGRTEEAIDQIEKCLSVPSGMTTGFLRVDPLWSPLRDTRRFRRIVEAR
jgi:non-specific serine/threonine protein kinase